MDWSRTVRFDDAPDKGKRGDIEAALKKRGAAVRFGARDERIKRVYALIEGPASVEASDLEAALPKAHWFDEALIVLAIEPTPADALPVVVKALCGKGGPSGLEGCEAAGNVVVVEMRPSKTMPQTVLQLVDVELKRFHGYRRNFSLAPLPLDVTARIASAGLQAEEIAPDRVLEALLERPRVD